MQRLEFQDIVYRTEVEKFRNAAKDIAERHQTGQPVLVGTVSVEKSEKLSGILKKMGIKHEVLNAKNHEREAVIISQAGRQGVVTVSTNMAGRGTDILLGGNAEYQTQEECLRQKIVETIPAEQAGLVADSHYYYYSRADLHFRVPIDKWKEVYGKQKATCDAEHDEVVKLGGLHIVGTERHESRRIDNQLRGRAGRQGDPGSARFYLSLEDDLMRIFGGERMQNLMLRLGMEEDVPIESGLITKRIAAAQKAVEAQNFASRKHVLEYDDVMNKQRKAVYGLRRNLLEGKDMKERVIEMIRGLVGSYIDIRCVEGSRVDQWDLTSLQSDVLTQFGVRIDPSSLGQLDRAQVEETVTEQLNKRYDEKELMVSPELMRHMERIVMLQVIDNQWKDHLLSMDHLKEGIGLRGYGQKDPLIEYKKESFKLFQDMMDRIEDETLRYLFFLQREESGPLPEGPYPDVDEEEEEEEPSAIEAVTVNAERQRAAQSEILDFTRNVQHKKEREMERLHMAGAGTPAPTAQVVAGPKVGRNDPCPCGSGKKYKKCHGS